MTKLQCELIEREFAALGFTVIYWNGKPQANGVDLWVRKKGGRPISVEVKVVRKLKNGTYQTDPVSPNRRDDDLVAIVINTEYVLIEPMNNHLSACGPKGYRSMQLLCKGN